MDNNKEHITPYSTYAKVLVVMLVLTALNITIATLGHSNLISGLIVLVAVIQAFIALTWFMHLKWDSLLMRIVVAGIFLLYAVVILITFLDYKFR